MSNIPEHFTQSFNIEIPEEGLEFFDVNLKFDSPVYIDPFLLRVSRNENEKDLFSRFDVFLKIVREKSIKAKLDESQVKNLYDFLNFREPKEINFGYTEKSNKGHGLDTAFAKSFMNFLLGHSASRVFSDSSLYPGETINPNVLHILADGLGPDGISDMAACIIMDYLISFTQSQCKEYRIPLKRDMPVPYHFDFTLNQWIDGYDSLPENPFFPGTPIILVPKRLLRSLDDSEDPKGKIVGILRDDSRLSEMFQELVSKNLDDIDMEEIRQAVAKEGSIISKYFEKVENEGVNSYDFENDDLGILAMKNYSDIFEGEFVLETIDSCKKLLEITQKFIELLREQFELRDLWKNAWIGDKPCGERALGRKIAAIGNVYFNKYDGAITFDVEVGTGGGSLDFRVMHNECKIAIELKNLCNSASTGPKGDKLPAYLHGLKRQLPHYSLVMKAKYAIYLTCQHWREASGRNPKNHDDRAREIQSHLPEAEKTIKDKLPVFRKLFYENIDVSPKASPSKL